MVKRIVSGALAWFKVFVAVFLMYAGIATLFLQGDTTTKLDIVYANRFVLATLGMLIFLSGATLFYGKVFKHRRIEGYGLFAAYNCYLFAGILNWYAIGWDAAWSNLIGALIMGLLYLRWKYHIYYPKRVDKTYR
jgi:hypothetical protein